MDDARNAGSEVLHQDYAHCMDRREFAFSYAPAVRALFSALGMGPSRARIIVEPDAVRVRMGVAFSIVIPRTSITSAGADTGRVTGWGVHGWSGTWLVNGSSSGLVVLTLNPPVPARLMTLFRLRVERLRLSLADPAGFLASVHR